MSEINKYFIKWNEVEEYVDNLCEEIKDYFKNKELNCSGVYGIPRGGLVIATMVSYKLNIPLLMAPIKDCVIVDDISDSGRTLLHFTENDTQFNNYFISTMFYHQRSLVKPHYYEQLKTDSWIVFPWETLKKKVEESDLEFKKADK